MITQNIVLPATLPVLLSEYDIILMLGCSLSEPNVDEEEMKPEILKDLAAYYKHQEMIVSMQPVKILQTALLRRKEISPAEHNLYYLEKEGQMRREVPYPYGLLDKIMANGASLSTAKKDYFYKDWTGGVTSQMARQGCFYLETAKEVFKQMVGMPGKYMNSTNIGNSTVRIIEPK